MTLAASPADTARVWVEMAVEAREFGRCLGMLARLFEQHEKWVEAMVEYLEQAARIGVGSAVKEIVDSQGYDLRRDVKTWGTVGYALVTLGRYRETVAWMSDWEAREGVPAWALSNLVAASAESERDEEAVRATSLALSLPRDHTYPTFLVWGAHFDVIQGNFERAAERLRDIDADGLSTYHRFFVKISRCVLAMGGASDAERASSFDSACQALREIEREVPPFRQTRAQRRAFHGAVRRIAKLRGGLWPRLWAAYRVLYAR